MFSEAEWQEFITTVAEMILQLRIDVRKETCDRLAALFRKESVEAANNRPESFSLRDVIRRPVHEIRSKVTQQRPTSDRVPLVINFSLVEKRTGKEVAHERWHITFSRYQACGSTSQRSQQIFLQLSQVHEVLMKLPFWEQFIKGDQSSIKRSAYFIDYEVRVGEKTHSDFAL